MTPSMTTSRRVLQAIPGKQLTLSMTTQRRAVKGIGNVLLVLMLLWTAIPFYWMIAT